jgi:Ser/Thr protein kinase RdoA (MazF antagonist)
VATPEEQVRRGLIPGPGTTATSVPAPGQALDTVGTVPIIIPEQVLSAAADAFGLDRRPLSPLERDGAPDGAVYPCRRDGTDCFLKIRPADPETAGAERDRAAFVEHLRAEGLTVPVSMPSVADQFVEYVGTVPDGVAPTVAVRPGTDPAPEPPTTFAVTLAEKVPGRDVRLPEDWNDSLIRAWGSTMGRMHRAAASFRGGAGLLTWQGENAHFRARCRDDAFAAVWDRLCEKMTDLPRDPAGFGLIHNDLHLSNVLLREDGELSVLDFDVCAWHWFVTDVATAMAHVIWELRGTAPALITPFASTFLGAYREQHPLDPAWSEHLDDFMRYRMALFALAMTDEFGGQTPPWLADVRAWVLSDEPMCEPLPWP